MRVLGSDNDDGWQATTIRRDRRDAVDIKTSQGEGGALRIARTLDLWLVGLALPLFLIAGLPMLGWVVGAGVWVVQRLVQAYFRSRVAKMTEPRRVAGTLVVSTLIRAWGSAAVVLAVGISDERIGLSAVVMIVALFSVYFAGSLWERYVEVGPGKRGRR